MKWGSAIACGRSSTAAWVKLSTTVTAKNAVAYPLGRHAAGQEVGLDQAADRGLEPITPGQEDLPRQLRKERPMEPRILLVELDHQTHHPRNR